MILALLVGILVAAAVWVLSVDSSNRRYVQLMRTVQRDAAHPGGDAAHPGGETSGPDSTGAPGGPPRDASLAARLRYRVNALLGRDGNDGADSPMIAVIDRSVQLLKVGVEPARVMGLVADLPGHPVIAGVLRKVARSMELGETPHAALNLHAGLLEDEDERILRGLASVWFVAEHAGAPAADMLASYASSCRDRADATRERDIALAGPTSTVMVLSWLPIISLGLAVLVGANLLELISSPPGALSVGGGLAMLFAGRVWMRSMLSKAR